MLRFPRHRGVRAAARLILAAALVVAARPAFAAPLDVVNAVRANGCDRGGAPPLQRTPPLDAAAGRIARGEALHDALAHSGYRADEALSIHVAGGADDAALRRILSERFCRDLSNARVGQVGLVQRKGDLWLVLAAPFRPPTPGDAPAVANRVLALVNAARAQPRRCGRSSYPAAAPLRLSATLGVAALAHSREMARTEKFAHEAADGSTPRERVERTGYAARIVGENIAAGPTSPDEVVAGWLDSPGHCANVMEPRFEEMGIAYAVDPRSRSGIYWTQVFATPR